jgi:hypothetical protein
VAPETPEDAAAAAARRAEQIDREIAARDDWHRQIAAERDRGEGDRYRNALQAPQDGVKFLDPFSQVMTLCADCGVMVASRVLHDAFHARLARP